MSEQYRYHQMIPFCRVDSLTYFIRGMASFFEVVFFLSEFFRK
ncbi:unnamed protein product [Staurois parvus]|uniref:Uncharacterized protein n=1 Tax=Staurois parvus TaxID=386267 RepID=A0ABN9ERS7_9NEOB|nr:unnamed protein product [Staurois parvus]